jgi:hypothetical protein
VDSQLGGVFRGGAKWEEVRSLGAWPGRGIDGPQPSLSLFFLPGCCDVSSWAPAVLFCKLIFGVICMQ